MKHVSSELVRAWDAGHLNSRWRPMPNARRLPISRCCPLLDVGDRREHAYPMRLADVDAPSLDIVQKNYVFFFFLFSPINAIHIFQNFYSELILLSSFILQIHIEFE